MWTRVSGIDAIRRALKPPQYFKHTKRSLSAVVCSRDHCAAPLTAYPVCTVFVMVTDAAKVLITVSGIAAETKGYT